METNELEFREMKNQLLMLQERLDKQVEIKEKQVRRAISEGLRSIRSRDMMGLVLCVVVAILMPLSILVQGYSLVFALTTFVLLSINAIKAYLMKLNATRDMDRMDLVSTSKRLLKYKHDQRTYILYALPVVLAWTVWYLYEVGVALHIDTPMEYVIMLVIMLTGGFVGGLIGYFSFYRPSMRDADKVINQINEITNDR